MKTADLFKPTIPKILVAIPLVIMAFFITKSILSDLCDTSTIEKQNSMVALFISVIIAYILSSLILNASGGKDWKWWFLGFLILLALGSLAYIYIAGSFSYKAAVSLEVINLQCSQEFIQVEVANEGICPISQEAKINITYPNGTYSPATCTIPALRPGPAYSGSCNVTRLAGDPVGTYRVRITSIDARSVIGTVFCSQSS